MHCSPSCRTSAHGRGIGRVYRTAARKLLGATVAGCGFRQTCDPCLPLRGHDGRGDAKDRGIGERRATRLSTCRVSEEVQGHQLLQTTDKLGVRVASDERKTTVVAGNLVAANTKPAVDSAGISKRVGFHTFRHTYTTLLTQNNEDVKVVQELSASRQQPDHSRFVRTGGNAGETIGTEQGCTDGAGQEVCSCLIPGPKLDQKSPKNESFFGPVLLIWTKLDHDSFCRFLLSA